MSQTARERIVKLLDAGSFVEIGAYVRSRNNADPQVFDGDGIITGYGTVNDALVYVYAQDPEVQGGSIGEMGAKKISNISDMALNMRAPLIALIDCAGVRLGEGNDSLYSFGRMFAHQAKLSGIVPQISVVLGTCGGGMAVGASMSDFVFMDKDNGKMFLNSPNAIEGNYEEKCDTSSAAFQAEETGVCDFTGTEDELFEAVRELVGLLPENNFQDFSDAVCTDDLNRAVAGIESLQDKAEMIRQIADDGKYFEIKARNASCITAGFIKLNGITVGVVANNSPEKTICLGGCRKAIKLIKFCDAFSIPVLTLADVDGFRRNELNEKLLPRGIANLTYTYASATVPKVTVVVGHAYGTAGIMMNSKSLGADIVYAWPDAQMGLMDKDKLNRLGAAADTDINSAVCNAGRGYVDDIIDPAETRQRVAAAFEMLYSKDAMELPRKHGTV